MYKWKSYGATMILRRKKKQIKTEDPIIDFLLNWEIEKIRTGEIIPKDKKNAIDVTYL